MRKVRLKPYTQFGTTLVLNNRASIIYLMVALFAAILGTVIIYYSHDTEQLQQKVSRLVRVNTTQQYENDYLQSLITKAQNVRDTQQKARQQKARQQKVRQEKQLITLSRQLEGLQTEFSPHARQEAVSPLSLKTLEKNTATLTTNLALRKDALQLIPNGKPVNYEWLSSPFKERINPITHKKEYHPGDDLATPVGTPVHATADGVVALIRSSRTGYGKHIILDHAFGFATLYAHLSRFNVHSGELVHKGQIIAWSGDTGESTGPHLHYEVHFLGKKLNPIYFIHWSLSHFTQLFRHEKPLQWRKLALLINNLNAVRKNS